jgi:hypothetical protein
VLIIPSRKAPELKATEDVAMDSLAVAVLPLPVAAPTVVTPETS